MNVRKVCKISRTSIKRKVQSASQILLGGGHWDFQFCDFGYFFRSVFRFFGFGVHWCLRIFHFLAFGFRFSRKNTNGFSDLISDVVFGFSYLTYLRFGFSSIWAAITRSTDLAKRKCQWGECVTISQWSLRGSHVLNDAQDFDLAMWST